MDRARHLGGDSPGIATTYRFLNALSEIGVLRRLAFGEGPARYELSSAASHAHMIEVTSGKVIEFRSHQIVNLVAALAARHGCRLIKYTLEVLVEPIASLVKPNS